MREIKFRAWDEERNTMYSGDEIETSEYLNAWLSYGELAIYRISHHGDYTELLPLQYTGLQDRNGKEAYHKDFVEYEGLLYIVEWDEENSGFYLAYYKDLDQPESDEHMKGKCIREGLIIGNKYENPSLLEVTDEQTN